MIPNLPETHQHLSQIKVGDFLILEADQRLVIVIINGIRDTTIQFTILKNTENQRGINHKFIYEITSINQKCRIMTNLDKIKYL